MTGLARGRAKTRIALIGACVVLACILQLVSVASADEQVGSIGAGAGEYLVPRGVAVDDFSGNLYVADSKNYRVDMYTSAGSFQRSFGWGVVASGPGNKPQNESQRVTVSATAGTFALVLVGDPFLTDPTTKPDPVRSSNPIPFDASAALVQSSLEAIPAVNPGNVLVSGPAGGPWTVEFKGSFADFNLLPMHGLTSELVGGAKSVAIETLKEGANYEICEPAAGDVCQAGQPGFSGGQMAPQAITVDNDPGSPAYRSIYVFDGLNERYRPPGGEPEDDITETSMRVQRFDPDGNFILALGDGVNKTTGADICTAASGDICTAGAKGPAPGQFERADSPIAVGPGGSLFVAGQDRLQEFDPNGSFVQEIELLPGGLGVPQALAVNSSDNFYIATDNTAGNGAVRKYGPAGNLLSTFQASGNLRALAVDGEDNLYVSDFAKAWGVLQFDSDDTLLSVIYGETERPVQSLAPTVGGGLFVVDGSGANSKVARVDLPPPGPALLPFPGRTIADPVGNTKATLNAELNPEGNAGKYHFEYVDEASYLQGGFDNAKRVPENPASDPSTSSSFSLETVSLQIGCPVPSAELIAEGKCLTPETKYRFRVFAENSAGEGNSPVEGQPFETRPPLEFPATWTTDVGDSAALLGGEVNPLGIPASGYFEYVDEETYQQSGFEQALKSPDIEGGMEAPINFGSGNSPVVVGAEVDSLKAGTTYRYRLFALTPVGPVSGPEHLFHAFARVKASEYSCLANGGFRTGPGALLPDCRAHEMVSPLNKGNNDITTLFNITGYPARLEKSAASGNQLTYSSSTAFGDAQSAPYTSQYLARRLPGSGWTSHSISPRRKGASFIAQNETQFKAFSNDLSFGWLVHDTEQPDPPLDPASINGFPNLYRFDSTSDSYQAQCPVHPLNPDPGAFKPEAQGLSADGTDVVFRVEGKLLPEASAKNGIQQVYECAGGVLRLVSTLPNGKAATGGAWTGTSNTADDRLSNVAGAVSADGSRIVWTASDDGPGALYLRVNAQAEQSKVEAGKCTEATKACTLEISTEPAQFWAAATDGSKVLYTSSGVLYEFDVRKVEAGEEAVTPITDQAIGLMGASADASRIYFASRKALNEEPNGEGEKALQGEPNLYLLESGGEPRFIGTLSDNDVRLDPPGQQARPVLSPIAASPFKRSSRVTADGLHAAFTSSASLTGYDNTDANSGIADAEVYLYDAVANTLLCTSCNPSRARPVGENVGISVLPFWAAAKIPGWANQMQASRVLAENGQRLYFESSDALVLHDTNGTQDVYQWEAVGSGDCSQDDVVFAAAAGGCISVISSGESPQPSEFVDAAVDGRDVFFKTDASLFPSDYGLIDIYDARAGGGLPAPDPVPPPCGGSACQTPVGAPDDPTPGTSGLVGSGGEAAKVAPRPRCPKGKKVARRHGRVRCVKKKPSKHAGKPGRQQGRAG